MAARLQGMTTPSRTPAIEHHHEVINGIRMHYVTAGAGDPIFFLHGFPEYWGVWKKLIAEFAPTHHVVVPDMRGANQTERPTAIDQYRIEHLVADVRGLADHLGIERFTLVAQDWGALVAWPFVLRHPERVKKFVTIDITHPALFHRDLRTNQAQQQASQYMLAFRQPGSETAFLANDAEFLKQAVFADARAHGADISPEDEAEWLAIMTDPGHFRAGLDYYRASEIGPPDGQGSPGGSNLLDGLSPEQLRVHVPTLILWGEQDPYLLPSGLEGIEEYVAGVTIERIPDASHWVTLEKPALVARHIRAFLAS